MLNRVDSEDEMGHGESPMLLECHQAMATYSYTSPAVYDACVRRMAEGLAVDVPSPSKVASTESIHAATSLTA